METAVVYAGFMAFVTEMFAPLLLCSSIPLGSPPVQDPNLGRIAPEQCVFYVGWAGMSTPDAKSANSAERFLADPEIRHMRAEAARRFRLLMKAASKSSNDATANPLAQAASIPGLNQDAAFWYELLVTRPCAGFVGDLNLLADGTIAGVSAGFVINVGDAEPKVSSMLRRYRDQAKDAVEERHVDGHIEYWLKIDNPPAQFNSATGERQTGTPTEGLLAATGGCNVPSKGGASKEKADETEGRQQMRRPTVQSAQDTTHADSPDAGRCGAGRERAQFNLRWALLGNYLIIAFGDESPSSIAKRMKDADPAWFTAVSRDLPVERRAAIARVDLGVLAASIGKADGNREVARQIKDAHLRAVTLVTGLGHDDFISQLLVETDGIAGALLKTIVDRPLKAEDMAVIPRDATLAMALRFNPNLIATGLRWLDSQPKEAGKSEESRSSMSALDVQNFLMLMAQSPTDTARDAITRLCRKPIVSGLDDEICTELAASLDDAWRLYTSPGEGSSIFNGMTGVVHVKDAGRLTKLFDKLAARKPPAKPDAKAAERAANGDDLKSGIWAVRKTRFADHDVYYMVRAQGESAGVLTWCLVKNELVWSLSPQNVKAYLLRQPGGPSLADEPAVIEALRDKQSPTLLMYEDSRRMFRMTYPLMQGWAMVAAAQDGLPTDGIDPMLLPAAPTIAKYLRPAVSTVSVAPKGVQLTMHQSLPNGNLGATLYCVLCSLLPANAGAFAEQVSPAVEAVNGAAGISPIVPRYMADPTRRTEELTFTDSVPAAANPNSKAGDSAPACVPSDAAQREFAPASSGTPAPASATAAPCVPRPVYPSTSTPEPYRPQYSATPQNVPGYAYGAAPQVPYDVANGYGVPTPSAPMPYAVPRVPPAPQNSNPPLGWAPAMTPYSSVPPAPLGYQPVIVYVPMVIYVPAAAGPGGNPPPTRLPAVYPSPSYAPPANVTPNYAPYAPPPATFDPYAPNAPLPAAQSSQPAPQSSFDTLMDVVGKKIAQGKSAEVERPLKQLSRCPDLSAEQRSQVAAMLERIHSESARPSVGGAAPAVASPTPFYPTGRSRDVWSIAIDPDHTGWVDSGGAASNRRLVVAVQPRHAFGHTVDAPAEIHLTAFDPTVRGVASRLGRWDFSAAETASLFRRTSNGPAICLAVGLPRRPAKDDLRIFVDYVTADRGELDADGVAGAARPAKAPFMLSLPISQGDVPPAASRPPPRVTFTEKEGPCRLRDHHTFSFFDKGIFEVKVGKITDTDVRFYIDKDFVGPNIAVGVYTENNSNSDLHCHCDVEFFDKSGKPIKFDGLSHDHDVSSGSADDDEQTTGAPAGACERVASYRVRFWEAERPPKQTEKEPKQRGGAVDAHAGQRP